MSLGGGVRLASGPYVTADPEAWRQAGRLDVYRDLVDHGDLALADHLGTTPDRAIARLPATGTAETLDALSLQGSQRFLVDADHLDPRPDHLDDLTQPVRLRGDAGSPFTALVVDPTLEQSILGISHRCLSAATTLEVEILDGSTFSAVRVGADEDIDGNGNVTCPELVWYAPRIFDEGSM